MLSVLGNITLTSSPFLEETSSQDHRPPSSTQKPTPSVSDLSGAPRPDLLFILWLQALDRGCAELSALVRCYILQEEHLQNGPCAGEHI